PQILEKLEERGVELLAVASDEFKRPLERKLNKVLGSWKDYFNHLITPRETESMKPSEEFYNSVLEKEGLDPADVAMVGDSWKRDLEPAQRCGLITILVSEEKKGDPDFHIKNLEELEEIMDEF
ncbi:MAG: HAD family hydrolase, partial [Candidatus Nanohaloarchaea archaeon]|nr:HAD family hydrolase [Candidatus Nanohaloarchaea archaeon]